MNTKINEYLRPTYFIDHDTPQVKSFVADHCDTIADQKTKAIQLYYGVRDTIKYDPYDVQPNPSAMKASSVAEKGSGYCVAKAVLLAAAARHEGIPARLGFADVKNHLSTARLRKLMNSDLFIYHGYTELYIDQRWVKSTPAFNLSLCIRFNVQPLEFDGENDSIFHAFDTSGQKHMEYVADHGHFSDLPFSLIFSAYRKQYPKMFRSYTDEGTDAFAVEVK